MPFPASEHVIYRRNPLESVICQLRFPTMLRIGAVDPAEFQESIQTEFPLIERKEELTLPFPPEMGKLLGARKAVSYDFRTLDGDWTLGLTQDFLALSTASYRSFADFYERFKRPLDRFEERYRPQVYIRVGLRYVNVIQRSTLGASDVPWSELLQPWIACELACGDVAPHVLGTQKVVNLKLVSTEGDVVLRHGLGTREITGGGTENVYILDADFSRTATIAPADVEPLLRAFNRLAGRLLRWSIRDGLHNLLGPAPAPSAQQQSI
jgi:uncharacterized protein (TIGR04255 family)